MSERIFQAFDKLPLAPWLYLVTDRELASGKNMLEIVDAVLRGGVNFIQYREKLLSTREMIREAASILELCRRYKVPFVVNDRVDVALAISADGVHLGQSDMEISRARQLLGKNAIIGVSASSVEEAVQAEREGADYIGASAVFSTSTKTEAPALGLLGVEAICNSVTIPVVGIGGINADNLKYVIKTGLAGIAVVSAIMTHPNPGEVSKRLREALIGR